MEDQKANWQLPIWKEDHREQPARHGGVRGGGGSSAVTCSQHSGSLFL